MSDGNIGFDSGRMFREIFAERHCCSVRSFSRKMFWAALHREHFLTAAILYCFRPGYYREDLASIERMGRSRTEEEFDEALWELQDRNELEINTFRVNWHLRISCQRIMDLRDETLGMNPSSSRAGISLFA